MLRCLWRPVLLTNARQLSSAAASTSAAIDKDALMKLRKRTGYSYVNCRKALVQFGPEKLEEAEKWLKELAKKEGWAKAAKLSNRSTSQGLVGFTTTRSTAAVVELLCETDFVARGDNFKALLEQLTLAAIGHAAQHVRPTEGNKINTVSFELDSLIDEDGRNMKEVVAMAVGKLGENITVKKIEGFAAPKGAALFGAAHPKDGTPAIPMGKFVSIIAMKRSTEEGLFPTNTLASQICQHIIGMRTEKMGDPPVETEKSKEEKKVVESGQDELNEFYQGEVTHIDEDETALLRQSFMLNPSQTVHSYLTGHKAEVVDFVRTELGAEKE